MRSKQSPHLVVSTPLEQRWQAYKVFGRSPESWEIVSDGGDKENVSAGINGVCIVSSSLPTNHTVLLALNHLLEGCSVGLFFSDGSSKMFPAGTKLHPRCVSDGGVETVVSDNVHVPYSRLLEDVLENWPRTTDEVV